MEFKLGDHVQIVDPAHPHNGEIGVIIGKTAVYYADGLVHYWHVDIGTDVITVPGGIMSGDIPNPFADAEWPATLYPDEPKPLGLSGTAWPIEDWIERELRQIDRDTAGGCDYESIGLFPVNNAMDGGE